MIKLAQQAGEEQSASETRSGGDNEEESNQPSEESGVDDTKKDKDYVPPADWRDDGDDSDDGNDRNDSDDGNGAATRKFNEQKNARDAGSWVLINFRSINNKEEKLKGLLKKNKDVLIITETWIKNEKEKDQVLRDMLTEEYDFVQFPREEKTGGGVAILFLKTLYEDKKINLISAKHFEYVAVELEQTGYQPVLVIGVYRRPPKTEFKDFLREFKSLLQDVSAKCKDCIILAGDFNIWVDKNLENNYKTEFSSLLNEYSLTQHVNSPTHKKGHTLDLVISRNVEVSDLSVRNDDIADHCSIYFNATPKPKRRKQGEAEENEDEDESTKRLKNIEE